MLPALGTTFFFAITPVLANRAAKILGSLSANLWRLVLAVIVLGTWAHLAGGGIGGQARGWFFLGGAVGFGVGGAAMFMSLPRLGANLSTLIVQCVAAVAAAALEWTWLGTALTPFQLLCASVTLLGVSLGLLPRSLPRGIAWRSGVLWALLSAVAQGAGAVLSRKAFAVAAALHQPVDPGTAAYQRGLGGLLVAAVVLALAARRSDEHPSRIGTGWGWVTGNALTGPVLGVTCYQWALRTTPAGLVQPIVAAAPLLTVPLALWLDQAPCPRPTYFIGAALAAAGTAGLWLHG
jgi:drug/metabolite transporter (DMT)-like permease